MPIVQPSGLITFVTSELASEVIIKCENRVTDTARANQWIVDTLIELTTDRDLRNEFDQLEIYGNLTTLTAGVQEYDDILNFVPAGTINDSTLDFLIWIDPPYNTKRKRLDMVSYQECDKFMYSQAQPIQCYRFGDLIGFYPVPEQAYQVQPRMQMQHPINDTNLAYTQILLPRDWNEVIVLGATMRGFLELEEYEKAEKIRDLLYGAVDENTAKRSPGLIYRRKKRREQEAWRKELPLRPVLREYGYSGRG